MNPRHLVYLAKRCWVAQGKISVYRYGFGEEMGPCRGDGRSTTHSGASEGPRYGWRVVIDSISSLLQCQL